MYTSVNACLRENECIHVCESGCHRRVHKVKVSTPNCTCWVEDFRRENIIIDHHWPVLHYPWGHCKSWDDARGATEALSSKKGVVFIFLLCFGFLCNFFVFFSVTLVLVFVFNLSIGAIVGSCQCHGVFESGKCHGVFIRNIESICLWSTARSLLPLKKKEAKGRKSSKPDSRGCVHSSSRSSAIVYNVCSLQAAFRFRYSRTIESPISLTKKATYGHIIFSYYTAN